MLSLVVCAALSQAPVKIAVVQSSNLGVPPVRAAELAGLLIDVLTAEKLEPVEANKPCDNRPCLQSRAKEAAAPAVVSVAFASLGKDTVMDLECIAADDGHSIAQTTFTVRVGDARLPSEATAFVSDVRNALAPAVAPKPSDTPSVTPNLTPNEGNATRTDVVSEGPKASTIGAIGFGVAALAAGIVSTAFFVLASNEDPHRAVHDGMVDLSASDAAARSASANGKYTVSLVTLLVAVVAAGATLGFALY